MTTTRYRHRWLVILMTLGLVAAACGSDSDDSGTIATDDTATDEPAGDQAAPAGEDADTSDAPDDSGQGLTVTSVDISTGTVTIVNNGTSEADLTDHQLCNRPNYVPLPSQVLAPGESIEVTVGGINADGGEVGLYTSGDFSNSDDLISYVTWGSGGGRLSVAEAAGAWSGDPIDSPGETLSLTGEPGTAGGWSG